MEVKSLETFIENVREAQTRAQALKESSTNGDNQSAVLLGQALEQMFEMVEELQVADTELHTQNEELVAAHALLETQKHYYQELFELAPDAYIVTDALGTILEANQNAAGLLKRDPLRLLHKPLAVLISLDNRRAFRTHIAELNLTKKSRSWQMFIHPTKSIPLEVSVTVQPVLNREREVERLYWLIRPLSEEFSERLKRERAIWDEEEQAAANLRTQYIGMVSHELRTPLSSIKGFISSLLAKDVKFDEAAQREFLEIIDKETDNLVELVDQLLDFSRVQAGALRVSLREADLQDALLVAHTNLESLTKQHILQVEVPDTLPSLWIDPQRIAQVILNLVDNAAKYSPPSSIITLSAHQQGETIQIDVCDRGVGIPAADRQQVFEAYRQTQRPTQKKGTGLGLAICKGIVESHGGMIWIQSEASPGTTISFTVPIARHERDITDEHPAVV